MTANTYRIKISKVNHFLRKISLGLSLIAVSGWILSDWIDFPVSYLSHLSFSYYSKLPEKLLSFLNLSVIAGLFAFFLFTRRKYIKAQLSITDEDIHISIIALKRIILIRKSFSFRPYRMEFVCPNNGITCIIFSSEEQIEDAIMLLLQIVPDK